MVKSITLKKKLRAERERNGEEPKGGGYKDRLNTNLNPTHWMNYLRLVGALLSHHLSFSQRVPLCSFRAVSPEPSKADG